MPCQDCPDRMERPLALGSGIPGWPAERAIAVPAVGQPGQPLERIPRADVPGQQPGRARRGEIERQHEHPAAPGVLGGVPCLVPEEVAFRRQSRVGA